MLCALHAGVSKPVVEQACVNYLACRSLTALLVASSLVCGRRGYARGMQSDADLTFDHRLAFTVLYIAPGMPDKWIEMLGWVRTIAFWAGMYNCITLYLAAAAKY